MNAYVCQFPDAANNLVLAHVEMARRIALRIARRVPDWISRDDLIAAGLVGLADAAHRFDPAVGESFIAFAARRVRGEILDELRRGDLLPRRLRSMANRVSSTIAELEARLGRIPEDEEVSVALGVSVEVYREHLEQLTHVGMVPLPAFDLGELAACSSDEECGPGEVAQRRLMAERLREALAALPERDALILSLYYVEELSYAGIGEILGLTDSRICQLHGRALAVLKSRLDGART
jgi:RNA polymerase sigma factor for flagellar operon FliA